MTASVKLGAATFAVAMVALNAGVPPVTAGSGAAPTVESGAADAAKSAFESAKELGTPEGWNAFLNSYPSGFYSDLARAYLKKAQEAQPLPQTAPPQPAAALPSQLPPSSERAAERSCSELSGMRSEHSREPTEITFINNSGMYRSLLWIDFDGSFKDYGGLNPGETRKQPTFRTHPWMVSTGPGDCLQIFLPSAGPSTVELLRLAADDGPVRSPPPAKKSDPPKKKLQCGKNYKLKNGECVLLQNCGKNAYRTAEGDCFCKKGYEMVNGRCRWPQDKQGFEVAPWKKPGCSTWQAQCSQGNNQACGNYEANCQVN